MKLAIVYDWIDKWGGAERILTTLFDAYPDADIYTLYADYKHASWAEKYRSRIKTTFLNSWYHLLPKKQLLTPFMPFAIETLNLSEYDVVFSVTSSFAKGVMTRPETKHLSYVFTPTRFLWHESERYSGPRLLRFARNDVRLRTWLQNWDKIASKRPDQIITLSKHSQDSITNVYQLPSTIVYPPFDIECYEKIKKNRKKPEMVLPKEYFLFVGRLEPYKRIDLLVEAFAKLPQKNLIIVGSGSQAHKLRQLASNFSNTAMLPYLPDVELAYVYQHAQALVMPQAEDFGYTALESIFFGTPVISYRNSGAAEIIQRQGNGILFDAQASSEIRKQVEKFCRADYNVDTEIAKQFSKVVFLKKISQLIEH